MPTPDALQRAIDEQQIRRRVEQRVLPYGGDKAVAASIARVHRETKRGTCVICLENYPCRTADETKLVLDS